jgi:hypothetical protein
MVHLIKPHYQRKRFFRPRRPRKVWQTVRRYQLLELVGMTGVIALVWLGAQWDNQRTQWTPEPAGVESASADLIIGVPVGSRQVRQPL